MSGGGGPDQITNVSGPPAYAQPYHTAALRAGANLASRPYQPYPGPQIGGFTPEQNMGLNAMAMRGMQGSPVDAAAQQQAVDTMQGKYLNPQTNPAMQNLIDYNQRQVMANYGAQLGRNFGNSGVQEVVGDAMQRAATPIYESERGRQMATMGMSPALSNVDYRDIQGVLGAGDARQGMAQRQMDLPAQQWMAAQGYPQQQLGTLGSALGFSGGYGTKTSPNPYQSNPAANAIGLGTLGYMGGTSLASGALAGSAMAPYAPWLGAALGAGAGLLM